MLKEHYKQWKTSTWSTIRSIYPPTDPVKLSEISTSNLKTTTFIKPSEENASDDKTLKELNKFFKQNNYSNVYLQVVGQQLTRI